MNIKTEFHQIGFEYPPYLIAEIGLNHNGDINLARSQVDAAAEAGAMAAKFQLYNVDYFIDAHASLGERGPGSLREFFRQFELSPEDWRILAAHTRKRGLDFFCSIFDAPSLELYQSLSPRLVKIASCDIDNRLLLEDCAALNLPILLSTGTAEEWEVEAALQWLGLAHQPVLFQCVSAYPARAADYNLSVLPAWRKKHDVLVGVSDHIETNEISFAAVALGARAIEKHFTMDRKLPGPDQMISVDPAGFKELALGARRVFDSLGNGTKTRQRSEMPSYAGGRRSLYAARDLKAGETPAREDLLALRPGGGISPSDYKQILQSPLSGEKRRGERLGPETV